MKIYFQLWIMVFSIVPILTSAQEYTPLVNEGSIWITWYEQDYVNTYHAFEITSDTLIDSTGYKKVVYHQLRNGAKDPYIIEQSFVAGAIREDLASKAIYGRLFFDYNLLTEECRESFYQDEEFLMYHFQYEVGDTISGCSFEFLGEESIVDTILYHDYFGQSRKVFADKIDDLIIPILIEGIGNLDGLFASWNPFISPGDGGTELFNFCLDGALSCGLISNTIDEPNDKMDITLSPNPVFEYLHLTRNDDNVRQFSIFDQQGQLILSIDGSQQKYYIGDLDSGVYFVKVDTDKGSFAKKIVKL